MMPMDIREVSKIQRVFDECLEGIRFDTVVTKFSATALRTFKTYGLRTSNF